MNRWSNTSLCPTVTQHSSPFCALRSFERDDVRNSMHKPCVGWTLSYKENKLDKELYCLLSSRKATSGPQSIITVWYHETERYHSVFPLRTEILSCRRTWHQFQSKLSSSFSQLFYSWLVGLPFTVNVYSVKFNQKWLKLVIKTWKRDLLEAPEW